MELRSLVAALLNHETLTARQMVVDAIGRGTRWSDIPAPTGLSETELAVAGAVVELLAERTGQAPPAWAARVPAAPEPVFLVKAALSMPRLRRLCEQEGPEPLRRRRILAPPEFLTFA